MPPLQSFINYPQDGSYICSSKSIYAQIAGNFPSPCRKFHISSDLNSADKIAATLLSTLKKDKVFHKVVKNKFLLSDQLLGKQSGKFITLYLEVNQATSDNTIEKVSSILADLKKEHGIRPGPTVPSRRTKEHKEKEEVFDNLGFIYGGFVVDPTL